MNNTQKLEKVKDLVNQIVLTVGTVGKGGTEEERTKLNIASSFGETFLKEEETEESYQESEDYNDSNCY